MRYVNKIRTAIAATLLTGGLLAAPALAQVIHAGDDAWRTGVSGGDFTFGDPDNIFPDDPPLIPANFFGPGSDPFQGTISFVGAQLCSEPPGALEATDTIVRRTTASGDLNSGPQAVEVQMLALSLTSIAPITVTYNGGQNPESWDVDVYVSTSTPQPTGTMLITKTNPDGGEFEATIPVVPRFVFTRSSPPAVLELDCGTSPTVCGPLTLETPVFGPPNAWVLIGGPGGVARADMEITEFGPGVGIDDDCDGYVPGVDPVTIGESELQGGLEVVGGPLRLTGNIRCRETREAEGAYAAQQGQGNHDAWISSPRDDNGDGIPDVCQSACCDHATATCLGSMTEEACTALPPPVQPEWFKGITCDDPSWPSLCWEHTGACCIAGVCTDNVPESQCNSTKWFKDTPCSDPDVVAICAPQIPVVSEWGLIILTLVALTIGTVILSRHRRRATT